MVDTEFRAMLRVMLHVKLLVFNSVIANCIQLLVQDLESACDPALQAMSKVGLSFPSSPHLD